MPWDHVNQIRFNEKNKLAFGTVKGREWNRSKRQVIGKVETKIEWINQKSNLGKRAKKRKEGECFYK